MVAQSSLLLLLSIVSLNCAELIDPRCSSPPDVSCSQSSANAPSRNGGALPYDCCVPHPAGYFSYEQIWDQDQGIWVPGPLTILNCDGSRHGCKPGLGYDGSDKESLVADGEGEQHASWLQMRMTGACISTIQSRCLPPSDGDDDDDSAPGPFELFSSGLDALSRKTATDKLLRFHGIYSSLSHLYSRSELMDALRTGSGLHPYIKCEEGTLKSVEYRFVVSGQWQNGDFRAPEHAQWISESACPESGILYVGAHATPSEAAGRQTEASGTQESSASDTDLEVEPAGPIVRKLKFFGGQHTQRMPDEKVWNAPKEESPEKPARDEL